MKIMPQLKYSQLKKEVGDAWAFLSNPTYKDGVLTSAELLYYDTNKSKVIDQLKVHTKGHYALHYFGNIDAKQVYLL